MRIRSRIFLIGGLMGGEGMPRRMTLLEIIIIIIMAMGD